MRILFVAPMWPDPPDKGERIRVFQQLAQLAREHRVHLICGAERAPAPESRARLEGLGVSVEAVPPDRGGGRVRSLVALLRGRPRSLHAPIRGMARTVERALRAEPFDVLMASTIDVAEAVQDVAGLPKALDLMDVTSELFRRIAERRPPPFAAWDALEARRLARREAEVLRRFDAVLVVSKAEARLLRERGAEVEISVLSNGVDLDAFQPPAAAPAGAGVVFTGSMDYLPNIDAVLHFYASILPRVRLLCPVVHLEIVGRNPARSVRALARDPGITVTGTVPDVRPFLARAVVAIAPFRLAQGIQNKVLEALACGVPVVGTARVLDALELGEEDGARRAEEPSAFAREVADLLRDPEWRAACSRAGRRFVEKRHGWAQHSPAPLLHALVERARS